MRPLRSPGWRPPPPPSCAGSALTVVLGIEMGALLYTYAVEGHARWQTCGDNAVPNVHRQRFAPGDPGASRERGDVFVYMPSVESPRDREPGYTTGEDVARRRGQRLETYEDVRGRHGEHGWTGAVRHHRDVDPANANVLRTVPRGQVNTKQILRRHR